PERRRPLLPDLGLVTLSILIWLPAAAALIGAFAPKGSGKVALLGALAALGIAIDYAIRFHTGHSGLQFVTDRWWISALGIHYKLGLDGLNVFLVLLTAVIFTAAIAAANLRDWPKSGLFYLQLALAESAVLGAFCAQDLILFVAFFDLMLVPFYFLVGVWGGPDRLRATLKMFIYALGGSLLMLAAAVATGVIAQPDGGSLSFALSDLASRGLSNSSQ